MQDSRHPTMRLSDVVLPLSPVFLGVLFFALAHGGLFPAMGIEMANIGYAESAIGFLGSAFFMGTIVGAVVTQYFVRRIRHIRWFVLLAGVAGMATVALSLTPPIGSWVALRFVAGVAMGGHWAVVESWINFQAGNSVRGRSLAIYECTRMMGVAVSPLVLGLFVSSNDIYVFAGILFASALIPVCFISTNEPHVTSKAEKSLSIGELLADSPLGSISCMVAGFILSAIFGMAGIFGERSGLTTSQIPLFLSFTLFAPVVTHVPIGFLSDHLGRRTTISLTSVLALAASLALVFADTLGFVSLILLSCIVSGMSNPLYALGLSYTNDVIDSKEAVKASGTMIFINGFGLTMGSAVAGSAMEIFGKEGLFISISGVLVLVVCSCLFSSNRSQKP